MSSPNLQEVHTVAMQAVAAGRKVLLDYFGRLSKVQEKHLAGLVSEADVESEKVITAELKRHLPNIPVLGEESSYHNQFDPRSVQPGTRWILDPLDGTTNYVHQFYIYAISLALEWEGELVYGLVDVPALGVTYHATTGQGAYKNENRMKVSSRPTLAQSLVATGFASSHPKIVREQIQIFANLVERVRGVRRAGSAAYDLCLVAEGIFDAYWERNLQPWDTAAGAVIVTEAGGKVANFGGEKFNPYQDSILAANPLVYPDFLQAIQSVGPVKN